MKYCDFCAPFYAKEHGLCGLKGLTSQKKIGEFFVRTALGTRADEFLVHSDDTYRKWFTGDRNITPELWSEISDSFDEIGFTKALSAKINDKALPRLFSAYGIALSKGTEPDKYVFVTALAEQFKVIISGIHVLFRKVDARVRGMIMQKHDSCHVETVCLLEHNG